MFCFNFQLRLRLREQRKEKAGTVSHITMTFNCCLVLLIKFIFVLADDVQEQKGIKVSIKELDDVLMRDVGGKIAESGRYYTPHDCSIDVIFLKKDHI